MKIAWFSPMVPDHSDVANFTQRLEGELSEKYGARFFTEKPGGFFEPACNRAYPAPTGVIPTELLLTLNEVDLPVYNLGNHPEFFSRTWFLSQMKPGIVILHDLKLHHFYEGIHRLPREDMPGYLAPLWEHYGRMGHEAGLAYWNQKLSIDFMAQHFPMTQWAVRNALAIVVHTPHALETLGELTRTPSRLVPLPYAPRATERPAQPAIDFDVDGRFTRHRNARLILFGYLNVNRRIVEFLTALSALPECNRFEVHLVGAIHNLADVEKAVKTLGLQDRVRISGFVSEAELETALDRADLAVNLRYPTMGEASGSQLRIWDHALPSLVTYSEGYATLPPETVFFVQPESEQDDIQKHLRHFLERPANFQRAGQLGRCWLIEHHLPSMYVARLDELFTRAEALRSRHSQLALADRVGVASARWARLAANTERDRFYAASISEMV